MTIKASQESPSELRQLAEELRIERVAIVDDAFDTISQQGLYETEAEELRHKIEANFKFRKELDSLEMPIENPEELTALHVESLLKSNSLALDFSEVWKSSQAGIRMESGKAPVRDLHRLLKNSINLNIGEFGSATSAKDVVDFQPQILFLDWYLGQDSPQMPSVDKELPKFTPANKASQDLAQEIWQKWPPHQPRPLVILMSSKPGLEENGDGFCQDSGILRGMFHFVSKEEITNEFRFKIYMLLFLTSLPAGNRLQTFLETLKGEFDKAKKEFLAGISTLTLTDFSYIQSLSLKNEEEPLGDYLLWLFSAYFGQLLLSDPLHLGDAALDSSTFQGALPRLDSPSDQLTKIYQAALFDFSVGQSDDLTSTEKESEQLRDSATSLSLGDVFGNPDNQNTCPNDPDLFLLISPQCDLVQRPISGAKSSLSILLLPGYLSSALYRGGGEAKAKTEPYTHKGKNHRIEWDVKRPITIPRNDFEAWKKAEGFRRVTRLRLPFVLEVQRVFAASLTRVGTPVSPPIFKYGTPLLLRADEAKKFTKAGPLNQRENAFLVWTNGSHHIVLTLPLVARLWEILEAHLQELNKQLCSIEEGNNKRRARLEEKIRLIGQQLQKEQEWFDLGGPLEFPSKENKKSLLGDYIQIHRENPEGKSTDGKVIAAVSLNLESNPN